MQIDEVDSVVNGVAEIIKSFSEDQHALMLRATDELPDEWDQAARLRWLLKVNPEIGMTPLQSIAEQNESIVDVAKKT